MAACINVCLAINIPIDHTELVARGIADNWEVLIVLTAAATLPATNIFFCYCLSVLMRHHKLGGKSGQNGFNNSALFLHLLFLNLPGFIYLNK
jgi:hypothetical protein